MTSKLSTLAYLPNITTLKLCTLDGDNSIYRDTSFLAVLPHLRYLNISTDGDDPFNLDTQNISKLRGISLNFVPFASSPINIDFRPMNQLHTLGLFHPIDLGGSRFARTTKHVIIDSTGVEFPHNRHLLPISRRFTNVHIINSKSKEDITYLLKILDALADIHADSDQNLG